MSLPASSATPAGPSAAAPGDQVAAGAPGSSAAPPDDRVVVDGPAGPPAAPRRMGSARNMVLSMFAVLAFVLVWVAMVPRPSSINQPAVDVMSQARSAKLQSGQPLTVAQNLPNGWSASNARYQPSVGGINTWHVQYTTPEGLYAAVDEGADVTPGWVKSHVLFGRKVGTRVIAGATWTTYRLTSSSLNAMLLSPSSKHGLTIVAAGTASYAVLQVLVEHQRAVEVPVSTPGAS